MNDVVDRSEGIAGVRLNKNTGKYTARMRKKTYFVKIGRWKQVEVHLGTYVTVEEASEAYRKGCECKILGYSPARIKRVVAKKKWLPRYVDKAYA